MSAGAGARRGRGLIVAAPASGQGKTIVALALMRAFADAGRRVAAAKAGPDYIDSGFHAAACGRPSLNLDVWAMRPATLAALVDRLAADAELVICEGVMGLFDGIDAAGAGSTADLAAATGWPVVLVVDARGMAASAAALVAGFARHRPGVALAGVILNRVGAPAHAAVLREAIMLATPEVAVLGALPRAAALELPSRHLGLVQAQELARLEETIAAAAALAARHLDLPALAALARPARVASGAPSPPLPPPGQRIAVARDAAFAFAYEATLAGWREAGAQVLPFSPLADQPPASDADAVFLPGGYPELHAGALAAATAFRDGLTAAAARGAWVYGECGGYMALGAGLIDAQGGRHRMAGLLPVETSFAAPRLHLGYRDATLLADAAFGRAGAAFRGHEFHYANVVDEGDLPALFAIADARGQPVGIAGRRTGRVAGSFVHLVDQRFANPTV